MAVSLFKVLATTEIYHPILSSPHLLMTYPEKNALIQPMIKLCGTIIATLPFIIPIMPSIIAGSLSGFGLPCPLAPKSAKNLPSLIPSMYASFRRSKLALEICWWLLRRFWARMRDRCSRSLLTG